MPCRPAGLRQSGGNFDLCQHEFVHPENVLVHTPHETPEVTVAQFVHFRPSSVGVSKTALEVGRQRRGRPRAITAPYLTRLRQASPGVDTGRRVVIVIVSDD